MKAIDNAKLKLRHEMQALQRRLALLEEFEKQGYSTLICGTGEFVTAGIRLNHEWTSVQWEDGRNGLRYEMPSSVEEDWDTVRDLHICVNCGVMRTTTFKLSDSVIKDPFDVLREEE